MFMWLNSVQSYHHPLTIALVTFVLGLVGTSRSQTPSIPLSPQGEGLNITEPSRSVWWVADTINPLKWTCNGIQVDEFSIFVLNTDASILDSPAPFFANINASDCAEMVIPPSTMFTPATRYQLAFTDPVDQLTVFARSDEFEIKPPGSDFSTATASPINPTLGAGVKGGATRSGKLSCPLVGIGAVFLFIFGVGGI